MSRRSQETDLLPPQSSLLIEDAERSDQPRRHAFFCLRARLLCSHLCCLLGRAGRTAADLAANKAKRNRYIGVFVAVAVSVRFAFLLVAAHVCCAQVVIFALFFTVIALDSRGSDSGAPQASEIQQCIASNLRIPNYKTQSMPRRSIVLKQDVCYPCRRPSRCRSRHSARDRLDRQDGRGEF
jgi:hypothetical protein